MNNPMTPEEFAERMRHIYRRDPDSVWNDHVDGTEQTHENADALMMEALESLGYGEGVAFFRGETKWYS